ncbi:hypothetical protein ACU4GD_22470 [Cupriavidus basilensis]
MIYISHRMAEVFALGDRITILRDGRKVGAYARSATPRRTNWWRAWWAARSI